MSLTVNVHGFAKFEAHSWHFGTTAAVELKIIQEDGDALPFTLFVRDGAHERARLLAATLNGAGQPASAYDPELDGLPDPYFAEVESVGAAMAGG